MRVGIWFDRTPVTVHTDARLERTLETLNDARIDHVQVMVNEQPGGRRWSEHVWKPLWEKWQLTRFLDALRANGFTTGVTIWPSPNPKILIDQGTWLLHVWQRCAQIPTCLEFDCEGQHKDHDAVRASVHYLEKYVLAPLQRRTCSFELRFTSYPYHWEFTQDKQLFSDLVHTLVPQAYNKFTRHDLDYHWDGRYGPGNMQSFAKTRLLENIHIAESLFLGNQRIVMGLAGYRQGYPLGNIPTEKRYRPATDALQKVWDTCVELGVDEVCYWSYKHLQQNKYLLRFLENRPWPNEHGAPMI